MNNVDTDVFDGRRAMCPLCHRADVRLHYYMGSVVFAEHPTDDIVTAQPAPTEQPPRAKPHSPDPVRAYVRCPLSLAPLVSMEDP